MADIKEILQKGIRFGAVRMVRGKQLDEAADQVLQAGTVTKEVLEQMGRDIAGDILLFNGVDVEQLNKVVQRMKKVGVVKDEAVGGSKVAADVEASY